MKKCISLLVLLALASVGAFAQIQMSAGGGLLGDFSFGNGFDTATPSITTSLNNIAFGGYGFFDITYAELSVYYAIGPGTITMEGSGGLSVSGAFNTHQIGFTVLGKFPISLGPITLFPMAGISYNIILAAEYEDPITKLTIKLEGDDLKDLYQFGILAGAGLDFDLSDAMFLRAGLLLHLRIPSKFAEDMATLLGGGPFPGLGPQIKVGVGFKF